jgi:hypothetical protein
VRSTILPLPLLGDSLADLATQEQDRALDRLIQRLEREGERPPKASGLE